MFPPKMCPGCHCYNETEADLGEIPEGQYHPCCDAVEDAPCTYAVIFGCDHSWPVITELGGGEFQYVGLPCGFPSEYEPPKFFYQVHRLKKECGPNCRWSEVQSIGDIGNEACADFLSAKMVPCDLFGVYFPSDQHTFPQIKLNTPPSPFSAVRACYTDYYPLDGDECYAFAVGDDVAAFRLWTLDLEGSPTLTWNFTGKPGYGNPIAELAALGKGPPVYTAPDAWNATGRNNMELENGDEWPSLPHHICVVAVGGPGVVPVCDSEESQCQCCDDGSETIQIAVCLDSACTKYNGCYGANPSRHCDPVAFAAEFPGATYPGSAPCCVWPYIVGDEVEEGCTEGGVSWDGYVLTVLYCTGSNYAGDVYCFDTTLQEWVYQGALIVTEFRCLDGCEDFSLGGVDATLCCTWVIYATMPEIDCCCPEEPDEPCCNYDDLPATGTIGDGTNTYTITKGTTGGGDTTYTNAGPITLCGFESTAVSVTCVDGVWTFDGAEMPCVGTMTWDGDCEAIILTFDCFGCTITATI